MGRVFGLLKVFRKDLIMMIIAGLNKDTPAKVRILLFLACLYVLSPVDILPDAVPFAGVVDDMVVIPAAVYGLKQMLPGSVAAASESKANTVIKRGGVIALVAALVIFFWISLIFFAFYKLLF